MSKLTPANENPWYLRMTLFGEQGDEIDEELAEWNSRAWETLGTTNSLTDRDREWLSRKFGSRLSRFADATQWRHLSGFLWQERSGSVGPAGSIPAPDAVNFSNTRFNRAVRIPPMSHCSFRGSIFEKLVELVQSGSLDLRDVEFNGPFSGLGLGSFDVQFDGAKFKCGADFSGVEFNGNAASFKNAEFHSHTNPEAATDDAHGVGWWQGVSFNGANFKAPINMEGAKFFGAANFASAEFHDQAHFKRAEFGTTTLFSHARFHAFSDFYGARFGKGDGTTKSVCFANTTFIFGNDQR